MKLKIGSKAPNRDKIHPSEQLLMYEHGFSITYILQICTKHGAEALGLEKKVGSIQKNKKANLLISNRSPFDNYKHFLAAKTVIKDGVFI